MKRLFWLLVVLAAAAFAVQGGEYGTSDLVRQRARHRQLQATVDSLRREVDSLRALQRAVATDPALQERIAREEFGMVRGDKEILYRFADPDSVSSPDSDAHAPAAGAAAASADSGR